MEKEKKRFDEIDDFACGPPAQDAILVDLSFRAPIFQQLMMISEIFHD